MSPLKTVILENNNRLKDIRVLRGSMSLQRFQCDHRNGFSDLSGIGKNVSIRWIKVPITFVQKEIQDQLPNLKTVVLRKDDIEHLAQLKRNHSTIEFVLEGSAEDIEAVSHKDD